MAPIDDALDELRSLKSGEKPNYTQVAKKYGIVRSTLSRRWLAQVQSHATKITTQRKLTPGQEEGLLRYIEGLSKRQLVPTREMIQNFASHIAHSPVSDSWVTRFMARNSDRLITIRPTGMNTNHHEAELEGNCRDYFTQLQDVYERYSIEPRHTYNMDERGLFIGITGRSKRMFSSSMYIRDEFQESLQDDNKEWVTVMACVCADGSSLPPAFIFQSANNSIQSSWVDDIEVGKHDVFVTSSPSGWTNDDLRLGWLEQCFDRKTKKKARRSYRLLIIDDHGSHVTMEFLEYCSQNRIILCVLPTHSAQILQPLDVAMFKPLSQAYSKELSNTLHKSQGLLGITKDNFFLIFWHAWVTSFQEKTILSSFKATGISPLEPDVILKRFKQNTPRASSSRESSASRLSAEDWIILERLVRSIAKDQSGHNAVLAKNLIHRLSTNELMASELERLKMVVLGKKKQNKKSAVPDVQPRQGSQGSSFLCTSRKFRKAQSRERVREREKQDEELKKAEVAELRASNKLHKEKLKQEKREKREKAKVEKERAKAEKAAEKQRQETRASEKPKQSSQKGKRRASQAPLNSNKRQKHCSGGAAASEAAVRTPSPLPRTSRSGRPIKPKKRYE